MAARMEDGLVLCGYQKKLKTMKKKFFVLYKDTSNNAARLEYYDTERKFNQRSEPKRVIYLKNCFNINRRFDTKYKYVLALSSRDGGFGIVFDSENELRRWLDNLLILQRSNANISDRTYPPFEHVWQVVVQKKGMSEKSGIVGSYHCCLTSKSVTFMCIGPERQTNGEDRIVKVEILLTTVRRCGHAPAQSIFYMELGRQSLLGSGELWMETEDAVIARNMHETILSAMSAKTESNMNSINSQGRPDLNQEPMRKRSSSATEASKPINVLHNKRLPIDIRNSISPHDSYGRERCDSLPTRNRTVSECSNQSYNASNLAFRSHTMSGLSGFRPYTGQRHNNSPPLITPARCSESEESSISVDETDDNGSFPPYRFSSRTSKGVIPEENMDDFAVDNKCNNIEDNIEILDNYISMNPVKITGEIENSNQLNQSKQNVLKEEFGLGSKHTSEAREFMSFNFPEHSADKLGKESDVEGDNQAERPTRAYSIGSKIEHTKINKRIGNVNDVEKNLPRVRAFSVGSRSKIPRCDLQHGFLTTKFRKEQNANGSNSNISMDLPTSITGLTTREKKSTSAPLLSLKSQINTERMSDLMEIDFSKITSTSHVQKQQQQQPTLKASQVPKFIPNPLWIHNQVCNPSPSSNVLEDMSTKPTPANNVDSSQGGYLEMKPVGNAHLSTNLVDVANQLEIPSKTNTPVLTQLQSTSPPTNGSLNRNCIGSSSSLITVATKKPHIPVFEWGDHVDRVEHRISQICGLPTMPTSLTNINKNKIVDNTNEDMSPKEKRHESIVILQAHLLESQIKNLNISCSCINNDRKLKHSVSNEDYSQNMNKLVTEKTDPTEAGYKILQIKSDSSLTSAKKMQRLPYKDHIEKQLSETVAKPNIALMKTAAVNRCSPKPELENVNTTNATKINLLASKDIKHSSSRPPSVTSEPDLHYATLDLPQCSGQLTVVKPRTEAPCESSSPEAIVSHPTNLYAKIDFDHSDSSSSSLKICNL